MNYNELIQIMQCRYYLMEEDPERLDRYLHNSVSYFYKQDTFLINRTFCVLLYWVEQIELN